METLHCILYHAFYKKQVLLTVCWKKESWIVAEYEKCGGTSDPRGCIKTDHSFMGQYMNEYFEISRDGFVHFISGRCLFLKVKGCRDNRSHSKAYTNVYIYSTVSKI